MWLEVLTRAWSPRNFHHSEENANLAHGQWTDTAPHSLRIRRANVDRFGCIRLYPFN